jgi:hypothetical protein
MFLVAVALLAGFGLAALQAAMKRTGSGVVLPLCLALIVVANVEALRSAVCVQRGRPLRRSSEIFKKLTTPGPGRSRSIFPVLLTRRYSLNARYMLVSTRSGSRS